MNLLIRISLLALLTCFGLILYSPTVVYASPTWRQNVDAQPFMGEEFSPKADVHSNTFEKRMMDLNTYVAKPLSDGGNVFEYRLGDKLEGYLTLPTRSIDGVRYQAWIRAFGPPGKHLTGVAYVYTSSKENSDRFININKLPFTLDVLMHFQLQEGPEDKWCTVFEDFSTTAEALIGPTEFRPLPTSVQLAYRRLIHVFQAHPGQIHQETRNFEQHYSERLLESTTANYRRPNPLSWNPEKKWDPLNQWLLLRKLTRPLLELYNKGFLVLQPYPPNFAIDFRNSDNPNMWKIRIWKTALMSIDDFDEQSARRTESKWSSRGKKF